MKSKQICIERDYMSELDRLTFEVTPEDTELVQKYLKKLEADKSLPYIVDPRAAQIFDEMIDACDAIAKEFIGKLTATVDYDTHSAEINLECLYVDFDRGEFLETLQKLSRIAYSIRFQPLTSGFLQIEIIMPYFRPRRDNANHLAVPINIHP